MIKETVKLNDLRMAPRKVRLVANLIKGLTVNEAEAQLLVMTKRAALPLLKLLRSAVANAVHNKKAAADKLKIETILVNQGPSLKRFLPRAMGRATPILKRTSHVVLVLVEKESKSAPRFNIISKKPKKSKKENTKKIKPKSPQPEKEKEAKKETKPKEKGGFFKKMFRRKSI